MRIDIMLKGMGKNVLWLAVFFAVAVLLSEAVPRRYGGNPNELQYFDLDQKDDVLNVPSRVLEDNAPKNVPNDVINEANIIKTTILKKFTSKPKKVTKSKRIKFPTVRTPKAKIKVTTDGSIDYTSNWKVKPVLSSTDSTDWTLIFGVISAIEAVILVVLVFYTLGLQRQTDRYKKVIMAYLIKHGIQLNPITLQPEWSSSSKPISEKGSDQPGGRTSGKTSGKSPRPVSTRHGATAKSTPTTPTTCVTTPMIACKANSSGKQQWPMNVPSPFMESGSLPMYPEQQVAPGQTLGGNVPTVAGRAGGGGLTPQPIPQPVYKWSASNGSSESKSTSSDSLAHLGSVSARSDSSAH